MENCRRSSLEERMSKNVLQTSLTHTNKIIEPKLAAEDSMIQRLVQQKKQLSQEHSHQMLFKQQRIRSLENQISIIGIKYQRLKKDYEEVIEGGKIEMIEELKSQNDNLIQKINQTQSVLEYVFDKVSAILRLSAQCTDEIKENGSTSSLSQSVFVQSKMDELEKIWRDKNKKQYEMNKIILKYKAQTVQKQSQIKLLNEHLAQFQSNGKKMKNTISTLEKILQSAESEKRRILAESSALLSNLKTDHLSEAQLRKMVEKLSAKEKDLTAKNSKLMEELYEAKEEGVSKLESALSKISKIKEQKEVEILKLKSVLSQNKSHV